MEGRKQFTFYRSYFQALKKLPDNRRLDALEAVIAYALDGTAPVGLDAMQEMAFLLIKPTLDAAWEKARSGQRGGRASKQVSKGEKENKKEKEKENEKENENELEIEDECLWRERFQRFWDLYPVKIGKEQAWLTFLRVKPEVEALCYAVGQWERSRQWLQEQGRFIPRPEKFLAQRQFEHLPGDVVPMGATGKLGDAELEAIRRVMEQ